MPVSDRTADVSMLSRAFVVLWIATFVAMAGIGMVSPLLPVYVKENLGGPAIAVALSFSGLSLSQLIAAPFLGRLGDRFGSKPFIVAGFFIYCIGAVGYLFAPTWEWVVGFRVLSGLGAAGIFPMSLAYIGRLAPAHREGTYMGVFSVAQIAGFGIGPLMGGSIRDAVSSDAAFATMAVLLGGTGIMTLLLLPGRKAPMEGEEEEPEPRLGWREMLRRPSVQAALAVQTVVSLGWGAGSSFLAVFVVSDDGLGTDSALFVGILLATRSVISATLQPAAGRMADRFDRLTLVMLGLGISAVGQFAIPAVPRTLGEVSLFGEVVPIAPWILVTLALVGVAEALAWPAQQAIFVTVGRSVGMGSIMGLNQMGGSLGFLGGSLVGALVVSIWDLDAVFRYAGIATFAGAGLFFVLMRRANAEMRALDEGDLPGVEHAGAGAP